LINTNNVPPVSLAQQSLYVHSASPVTKHHAQFLSAVNHDPAYSAFHNCSLSQYPAHPRAHDFSSHRIHVSASVNGASVSDITIDAAADVPCVSATFIRRHVTLDANHVRPVPSEAINLRSVDGPVLEVVGYIRFDLTLGRTTLPIEALVLPHLGPDKVLLENSIMGAFGAVLDCSAKTLTFRTDHVSIPAIHRRASAPD